MKKIIEIPAYDNNFHIHASEPLVKGDVNAYEIVLNLKDDATGAQLVVQAKRADDEVVTDNVEINGKTAKYTLKNNMYSIPGDVHVRLQVIQNNEVLTTKQCSFFVEDAYTASLEGDDRVPALTSLISQAHTAAQKADSAAQRVPDTSEFEELFESKHTHDNKDILDNINADTYATKDEIVGQKTDVGEIFNDYNNNKAFSPFSHSAGYNTKAGMRGFFYSNIEFGEDNDVITLSDMQNYGTDTDTDLSEIIAQYPIGSEISMVNGNKFYNCAKIVSTSGNTITVEKLPFDSVVEIPSLAVDDYSLWVESLQEIGAVPLGYYAHAEGENSIALERASHAEGRDNFSYGQYSHTEGRNNKAAYTGHAEGRDNHASGETSHAEGRQTIASGYYSHAEGRGTIAAGESQHVQGKYNIEDTNNEFAHIVGNGTSDSKRSNAHTLDWKGNAWYAGDVVAGDVSLQNLSGMCKDIEYELYTVVGDIETALDNIIVVQNALIGGGV